jgi:hypothetical protein
MAYDQSKLRHIGAYKSSALKMEETEEAIKPPKKVFGQKKKKRKDKVRDGKRAGVATGIAGALFFGLTPLVRSLQRKFGRS